MAAPSYVSSGSYWDGSTNAPSLGVPSGAAAGMCAVVVMFVDGNALGSDPTPPSGFAPAEDSPVQITGVGGAHSLYVWLKRITGADTGTYDFSLPATRYVEAQAHLYEDVAASGDLLDSPTDTATDLANSNTTPAVQIDTEGPDRTLLFAATCWSGGTWTEPSGYAKRMQDAAGVVTLCDAAQAVAGSSGAVTATISNADKRCVWLGALRGTTSGAAEHEAEASASVTAGRTATASASKPAAAASTVTVGRAASAAASKSASASLAGTAGRAASASAAKPAAAALTVTASAAAAATASKPAAAALSGTVTAAPAAVASKAAGASLGVAAGAAPAAAVVKPLAASLSVTAGLVAAVEGAGEQSAEASGQVTAGVAASASASKPVGASLPVSVTAAASAIPVRPAGGSVAVAAGLSASAEGHRPAAGVRAVSVALSASLSVVRPMATSLPVVAGRAAAGSTGGESGPSGTIGGRTAIAVSGTAGGSAGVAIGGSISG